MQSLFPLPRARLPHEHHLANPIPFRRRLARRHLRSVPVPVAQLPQPGPAGGLDAGTAQEFDDAGGRAGGEGAGEFLDDMIGDLAHEIKRRLAKANYGAVVTGLKYDIAGDVTDIEVDVSVTFDDSSSEHFNYEHSYKTQIIILIQLPLILRHMHP